MTARPVGTLTLACGQIPFALPSMAMHVDGFEFEQVLPWNQSARRQVNQIKQSVSNIRR